ncbi:MAG: hypothetical protein ACI8QD_002909 [Cyclobacteriaceae bacterium]|jgi:hypothetical protein
MDLQLVNKEWYPLISVEKDDLHDAFETFHTAVQNISSVGRTFLPDQHSADDDAATLIWVPGLWRLAGQWIPAAKTFRSSISFKDFTIYLVDQKLNTLGSLNLTEKSYQESMLWLEQQIISLELSTNQLSTELPYELPLYAKHYKDPFNLISPTLAEIVGGYFHNTYLLLTAIKHEHELTTDVRVYPHHFDMEMKIILKKTGDLSTDTYVRLGFSPGEPSIEPYLYINSWPYPETADLPLAPAGSEWRVDDWVGLSYPISQLLDTSNQAAEMAAFFSAGLAIFTTLLLD